MGPKWLVLLSCRLLNLANGDGGTDIEPDGWREGRAESECDLIMECIATRPASGAAAPLPPAAAAVVVCGWLRALNSRERADSFAASVVRTCSAAHAVGECSNGDCDGAGAWARAFVLAAFVLVVGVAAAGGSAWCSRAGRSGFRSGSSASLRPDASAAAIERCDCSRDHESTRRRMSGLSDGSNSAIAGAP